MRREVIIGNALDVLKEMPDESVDVVVTSPPYWALRDYGSEPVLWGGNPDCEHEWEEHRESARGGVGKNANVGANRDGAANNRGHPTITQYCTKCGAWKGQLGLEPTFHEYIDHLLMIFDEVHRVLKPTGACWINLSDTYAGSKKGNTETGKFTKVVTDSFMKPAPKDVPRKSLCLIPERFAIAMVERGWVLRNSVRWTKGNVMPQSCTDRFTVDNEPFFFFTKDPSGYYFNQLKEPCAESSKKRAEYGWKSDKANLAPGVEGGVEVDKMGTRFVPEDGRNMRTTWNINTSASQLEHCAMFPKALIERPIQACCPPGGVVLDPFCGSGTTLEYCYENGIDCIGIEINPAFKRIIEQRMRKDQMSLGDFDGQ